MSGKICRKVIASKKEVYKTKRQRLEGNLVFSVQTLDPFAFFNMYAFPLEKLKRFLNKLSLFYFSLCHSNILIKTLSSCRQGFKTLITHAHESSELVIEMRSLKSKVLV